MPEIKAKSSYYWNSRAIPHAAHQYLYQKNLKTPDRQKVDATIRLGEGDDISRANIQHLSVTVNYKSGFLKAIRDEIKLGSLISSTFDLNNLTIDDAKGEIKFDLLAKTSADFLNGTGDLFHIAFNSYLPTQSDTSGFSEIKQTITARGSSCLILNNNSNSIELKPTCLYDLRKILWTGGVYDLHQSTQTR